MTAGLAVALFPDIQFQLPALRAVAGNTPDLECADLRHPRFQADRQNGSLLTVDVQGYLERVELFDIVCPVLDQIANVVLLAHRGTEETELCRLTHNQTELATRNLRLRSLFHSERHDTQRLHRRFHPWDRRHCALDSNVVGPRGAAADAHSVSTPHPPVVSGAPSHSMLKVRSIQHLRLSECLETLLRQPAVQHAHQAVAQHGRLHHAAIEKDMRGARQTALPAPSCAGLGTILHCLRQKTGQVFRNRSIGSVRQPEFLKSASPLSHRHLGTGYLRKETFYQHAVQILTQQFCLDRAADQFASFAQQRYVLLLRFGMLEQILLRCPALVPEPLQLIRVNTMPLSLQLLLQQSCQGKVHVVAAQQDVLSDRNPLQRQVAVFFRHRNQAEIGGAASYVAHQYQVADFDALAPTVALALKPRIESRLRFFEKGHPLETRLRSRAQRQLTGLFIKRCRHRKQHVLLPQAGSGAIASVLEIPCRAHVLQVLRRSFHRRDLGNFVWSLPR